MDNNEIGAYYEENRKRLLKSLMGRVDNFEDAEDVLHTAFMETIRCFKNYSPDRPFEGWFVGILQNCARDYVADKYNRPMLYKPPEELADIEVVFNDNMWVSEKLKRFTNLSSQEAMFLDLYYLKDLSWRDVRLISGLGNRALTKLRDKILSL